jgi:D-glycero-alpha-D-manno-heptose 1-phosphate guanylyltransferase
MEAVILAGGLGTRLKSIIQDIPKPMADINGRPFLAFVLENLIAKGVDRFVISAGYKHEVIREYFKNEFNGVPVIYCIEDEPLGTGGGIKKSLELCTEENVLILNGDTFFNADLVQLSEVHAAKKSNLTMVLRKVENAGRYGNVEFGNDSRLSGFKEKNDNSNAGYINGGIYLIKKNIFTTLSFPDKFSFEKDFLEKYYSILNMYVCLSEAYFIDIGIPTDYEKAKQELKTNCIW